MGCSTDMTKPLPCPKCGKEPRYTVWYPVLGMGKENIHQFACCNILGRRHSKQAAMARWNLMALEYALERREGE